MYFTINIFIVYKICISRLCIFEATNTKFQHCTATQFYLSMELGMCA